MRRAWGMALLGAGLVIAGWQAEATADDKDGVVLEVDGMKATVPADWKEGKVKNRLRWKTFICPKVKDDKMDVEISMFKEASGTPEANVERWKGQFDPPEGKKIDDVAKVTEIMIGKKKATFFEVYGTYKFKEFPMAPKVELRPDSRMLAVQY